MESIRAATGLVTTTDHIPLHGMLDPDIIRRMLENAGAGAAVRRRAMPEIIRKAQALYVRRCPNLERKVCPGARRVLWNLTRRGALIGLVTGNLTRIGWKKMECAGLKRYFRFGFFGEMGKDRSTLVRLAIRHARSRGWIDARTPVSLIGDAPADIEAAQANGIRSVAVATGITSAEELACCSPDLLLEDLRALRLEMLL